MIRSFPIRALAGTGMLTAASYQYRADVYTCSNWPPMATNLLYGLLCVAGMTMLMWEWWSIIRTGSRPPEGEWHDSTAKVFIWGAVVLAVAALGLPFFSSDSSYYAAIGRSVAVFGNDPKMVLSQALPANDPYFVNLMPNYKGIGSVYGPLFNALAWLVGKAGGTGPTMDIHIYQAVFAVLMVVTALLVMLAVKEIASRSGHYTGLAVRAAALVLFCPLTVVEAVQNAHNDTLLLPFIALFALLAAKGRLLAGAVAAGAAVAFKFNAVLVAGYAGLAWAGARLMRHVDIKKLAAAAFAALVVVLAVYILFQEHFAFLGTEISIIVGKPSSTDEDHCIRSFECLPRLAFSKGLKMPAVSWGIGLLFRLAGIAWLLYASVRAVATGRYLQWGATFLFIFFMFFYPWAVAWYRLLMVPLLPFVSRRIYPAVAGWIFCAMLYYAFDLAITCQDAAVFKALCAASQGVFLLIVPTLLLIKPGWLDIQPVVEDECPNR
jgi:hypothetical protein